MLRKNPEIGDILESISDENDRRRAEEALRRSEEQYRSLFETMTQGVVYFDPQGGISSANPAASRILGASEEELVGRTGMDPAFRIIHEDGTPFAQSDLPSRMALTDGRPIRSLVMGIYNVTEKQYRWVKVDAVPQFRQGEDHPFQVYAILDDITERRRSEELMRASEKLAATGRLAASIAHEINNPLESVTNLLYLIEQDARLPDQARAYVAVAQQELGRVAHIARQTLGFYRDTSSPVPVSICTLLDSVLDLYDRKLRAKNITIVREYGPEQEIDGFPGELRQVFSNLIINAIESVGAGGRIRLRVCAAHGPGYPEWSAGLRVTIADTGPGIGSNYQQKVFEPFFTTKGERGTGLGLWVSRGIVQKHGGSIRFRSSTKPQRSGTAFRVFLPFGRRRGEPVRAVA